MKESFVTIKNLNLKYAQKAVLKDLNWTIYSDENWLLSGLSGSGKTTLAKAILGKENASGAVEINFKENTVLPPKALYVESWYQFKNLEGAANFYYQQRYTSKQAKEIITVGAELALYGKENELEILTVNPILEAFGFLDFLNAQLIELSSGEHKKLQLIKALWLKPQLLIIDQPYTGLDSSSRKNLNTLLDTIASEGVQLMLISNDTDLPKAINRFATLNEGKLTETKVIGPQLKNSVKPLLNVPHFLSVVPTYSSSQIAKMVNVNINYGEKQVLKNINWEVKAGEKWLLQGHNGSGKSTLLSLINGDHPQSYANELYLFGNRRGSGESIWDIKQHIGLISPEFHWYFDGSSTVWESIASGFYDTVGLFQHLPHTKHTQVDELVDYFGLADCKNQALHTLPLGKQRLALLARTIIKNPELLILDEPCQGLDQQQAQHFNELVDQLCSHGMTLIYVGHFESQLPNNLTHRLVLKQGEVIENTTVYEQQKELAS